MIRCSKCKQLKDVKEFHKSSKNKRGLHYWCKQCVRINCRKRSKTPKYKAVRKVYYHSGAGKKSNRKTRLKREYGMTLEVYSQMFEKQNGLCAICGKSEEQRMLSVDHDHKTGKVRKLLCSKCNTAIGLANEDVDLLLRMIAYINNEKERESKLEN